MLILLFGIAELVSRSRSSGSASPALFHNVLTVRELFPASKPPGDSLHCCCSAGEAWPPADWLAGLLYDRLGYYEFAVGIGANIFNLLIVSVLVGLKRQHAVEADAGRLIL